MSKQWMALALAFALLSAPALAYPSYGGYSAEYGFTRSSERVSISESEYAKARFGGYHYYGSDSYDYGRSRTFSFSRDYENVYDQRGDSFNTPYGYSRSGNVDQDRFAYSTTGYPDYRPFSDAYAYSFTSPYYNPSSRFSTYYGHDSPAYVPNGY